MSSSISTTMFGVAEPAAADDDGDGELDAGLCAAPLGAGAAGVGDESVSALVGAGSAVGAVALDWGATVPVGALLCAGAPPCVGASVGAPVSIEALVPLGASVPATVPTGEPAAVEEPVAVGRLALSPCDPLAPTSLVGTAVGLDPPHAARTVATLRTTATNFPRCAAATERV
jgi:hypothetical protein